MKRKFYLLPTEYSADFAQASGNGRPIGVEDFAIAIDPTQLTSFPDFESFEVAWLGSWKAFFEKRHGQQVTQREIFGFCQKLVEAFQLDLE